MGRSRTDELLVYCLRTNPGGAGAGGVEDLSRTDWEELGRTSALHGTTPLLYHRLTTSHTGVPIPADVLRSLRNSYLQNAARNMHLYHELGKVLGRFRENGIPVIALKGAHLAGAVYGNFALRPMGDVDLLVRKTDLLRAQDLLVGLGYAASKDDTGCSQLHLPPYRKKGSAAIEVHLNIVSPPFSDRVDVGSLFVRAQACVIEGCELWTLCPEDLLLHLCMHASYHHGFDSGVMPLFDISTVVERYSRELDWEQVLGRSKEWGVGKCVYLALSLAERIAGASIPDRVRVEMEVYRDSFNATSLAEELLFEHETRVVQNVARLSEKKSVGAKLIHLVHYAFPPLATIADMNPGIKSPFSLCWLYVCRIKGLFARHGRTTWKLLSRDKEVLTLAGMENRRTALKDWVVQPYGAHRGIVPPHSGPPSG